LGPALLGGILFFATFRGRAQQSPFLYIAWIVCNLPSLMSGAILGAMDPLNSVLFWAFNVLYPLAFYFAIGAMRGADLPQCMLSHFVSITVLALCLTPVLLIPIELTARQTTSFTELQFGGRAYAVIGAVTLTAPALLTSMSRRRMLYQAMSLILIILLFASSFSRGGLVTFALLALGTFAFGKVHRGKLAAGGLATILFLVAVGWYFIPETIGAIGWFWLLRMNVVSNLSDGVSFDAASIFDTGRSHIWDIASSLSMDSPFWGYGVGSTPSLLFTASGGEFRFSGMHNMLLTILVERGFLGLLGALVVLGRIGYLVYRNRNLPVPRMYMGFAFLLFLVFANSTGVEFFQNSTRSLNANITVILIVLIGYLEYDPKILPHDERFDLASEMTDNGGVA
ncbi:MAG TPA: O-antigen ligase family protein, partial [Fibrobacteria bacterium]|nr:O-antigen ligase family protein [Fibrobacteria bacterium]